MQTITASHANGEYPIYIGSGTLKDANLLQQHISGEQAMVVTNTTVAPLYLETVLSALKGKQCDQLILEDGEAHKTMATLNLILDALADKQHHRDTTLIALGGGVIGDMTGFAAACYHRGVNFIQIPTTMLAQVDASIGGKTAVNHPAGKNLIGAFHQPQAVIIDIDTLNTLPEREGRAGLAEMVKAALVKDANFFSWLETNLELLMQHDPDTLITALHTACTIKRDIVAADETEQGIRAWLNLGHTFGHAIEHCLGYGTWLHGEAVAMGILLAADLSQQQDWLTATDMQRIHTLFKRIHLPNTIPNSLDPNALLAAMNNDKKILKKQLRLILLKKIGEATIFKTDDTSTLLTLFTNHLTAGKA